MKGDLDIMYRIIAKNKENTEGYAEIIESVHPIGNGRAFVYPVPGGLGYFCDIDELIDIDEADILHKCGSSMVKVRLKGEEK